MIRFSYKYLFLLNTVAVLCIVIAAFFAGDGWGEDEVRASLTTPLLNSDTLDATLCENAKSASLIDAKSGAVLFEKNSGVRLPMASTTKIMTALVVIENSSPEDVITVSQTAADTEGSSIYLEKGEKITVKNLLYGLMLESGNDAAVALAEGVFGSVEGCCRAMNERAEQMGLVDTHFANPHGLDDADHYTTAYELALITKYAMENSFFCELVSTKSYVAKGEKDRYFSNHNRLLKTSPRTVGVKTGYTSRSGRCLVSAVREDNNEYIAVTLNDSSDWNDHEKMHAFATENFKSIEIADKDSFVLYAGFEKYRVPQSVYMTLSGDKELCLCYKFIADENGGRIEYSTNGKSLGYFYLENCTMTD